MEPITSKSYPKGHLIDGKYTVQFFVKRGAYAETYRVKNRKGELGFLKLWNFARLKRSQFDEQGHVLEASILKQTKHPNIVRFIDEGELVEQGQRFGYLVLGFISGESLADKLKREQVLGYYEARQIVLGVLNGLKYLHQQCQALHNDVTIQNVLLDLSGQAIIPILIDFGSAKRMNQPMRSFDREGLNPYYLAPECFNGVFSAQSDVFAVGAMLYHLLCGLPPWFVEVSKYKEERTDWEELILQERRKALKKPQLTEAVVPEIDSQAWHIIKKALQPDVDQRFQSVDEMIRALNGEFEVKESLPTSQRHSEVGPDKPSEEGGFDEIAGMDELKEILYTDVIRALREKELYQSYGLTIPNGMLLWGPPGCGKTFIAKKFSEEVGFNFISIKPSDLASIYVHGAQEKIGQLFKEAREKAPTILFFDELDALMPARTESLSHSYAEGVNEFLSQMTDCSKDGVFIIGATNRPDKVDSAIRRTGRMDKIVYLPPPDLKARTAMFHLYLKDRPLDFGIDYEALAQATENFVSSDIEFLVNEAARKALRSRTPITQSILMDTINGAKPSVTRAELHKYEQMRKELEGGTGGAGIGFKF